MRRSSTAQSTRRPCSYLGRGREPLGAATPLILDNSTARGVNQFAVLAEAAISSLDRATRPAAGQRPLPGVMSPLACDELRAVLISGKQCWGAMPAPRGRGHGFDDQGST
jgi:hypothetical protein